MPEIQLDIIPFLLEAFAHNEALRKDIDKIYQKDKYNYYKIAKTSKYYNHRILLEGDIYRQEYGRKMLGILLHSLNSESTSNAVIELIKKHYRKVYNIVQKYDIITAEMVVTNLFDDYNTLHTTPDDEINSIFTIVLFLCSYFHKKLDKDTEQHIANILLNRTKFYSNDPTIKIQYNLNPQLIAKTKSLKDRIYNNIAEIKCFNDLIFIKEESLAKWSDALAFIFDYEDMSSPSIYKNINFADQDIEEILSAYYNTHRNQNLQESTKFLIAGMHIKYLTKAYKELKEYYFQNNKETMYVELEGFEKENASLKKQVQDMQEIIDYQNKQINNLKMQLANESKKIEKSFNKQIRQLQTENKKLKKQIMELQKNENELIALREMMFSLEQKEHELDEEMDVNTINTENIIIVGGHVNWQNQIKDKLPNIRLIDTEALNFNPDTLSHVKLIVFNTAYMNHGMYYKMINYARNNNINVGYITNQNLDLSIKQIYNIWTKILQKQK